jgi:hypothetical protein
VDIDVSQASGPPVENYGYLKSKPTKPLSAEDVLRALDKKLTMIDASVRSEMTSKGSAAPHSRQPKP